MWTKIWSDIHIYGLGNSNNRDRRWNNTTFVNFPCFDGTSVIICVTHFGITVVFKSRAILHILKFVTLQVTSRLPSPCTVLSKIFLVNSLWWRIQGEQAGNGLTSFLGTRDPTRFGRAEWGLGTYMERVNLVLYPHCILITSPPNIKLWEKVRHCWGNKHATSITLKLSTGTRGGGRVAKIDCDPGVPIIKKTTFLRHHGQIYSRGAECITTDTSMRVFDGISTDYINYCGELIMQWEYWLRLSRPQSTGPLDCTGLTQLLTLEVVQMTA